MSDDLAILSAWRIGAVRSISTPELGTINRTLLVDSAGGSYALRAYRHPDRAPVEREHEVIAHVCAQGLPAVAPIALPSGATILERNGRFYALFPRASGQQIARGQLTRADFTAMGAFLARVHAALYSFPIGQANQRDFAIDRSATLAGIAQIEAAVRALPMPSEIDRWVLRQLAGRRAWIAQSPLDALPDMSTLEQQIIHGDYQETNLFLQDNRVVAIIDWDQTYVASREWELARTLDLVCTFELEASRAFLDGYRADAPLDPAALDLAATAYGLMRAHDLWLYRATYLEDNQPVRKFVVPGEFVSLIDRWAALKEQL